MPTVMIVDGLGSSEAGGQLSHVSTGSDAATGSFPARAGQPRPVRRPRPGARARRRRGGLAGQERSAGPRLPRRRRQDGAHLPRRRRRPLRHPRRPGALARRRQHRAAGPRRRDDQLGRREDLRRGGRAGDPGPSRRLRLRRRRAAQRALGQRGRRHRAAAATGPTSTTADLLDVAAGHIARYKLPKAIVFVDEIVRSPSGKADYRWARQRVAAGSVPVRRWLRCDAHGCRVVVGLRARRLRRRRSRQRRRSGDGPVVATIQVVDEPYKIELATPELIEHARQLLAGEEVADPARHGRARRPGRQRAVVVAHRPGHARVRRHDDRGLRRAAVVRRGRHRHEGPVLPVVGQGHRRRPSDASGDGRAALA